MVSGDIMVPQSPILSANPAFFHAARGDGDWLGGHIHFRNMFNPNSLAHKIS
jgi:hypothetical protein